MALSRKFLTAMGIDDDKIDEIIHAHRETVDALKEERDQYKTEAEQLPSVKAELEEYKAKVSKNDEDAWESKYNDMKAAKEKVEKDFNDFKADAQAKETKANKKNAYRALLKDVGITEKRLDAVLKVTDFDSIELGEDGAIKNADELKKTAKTEWAEFIGTKSEQGANTPNPPANNGGGDMTKEQIMAVKDRNERQRLISENHSLFGY